MPLWTTVIRPVQSLWGWAFRSLGRPCVAQRVWPRPMPALGGPVADGVLQHGHLAGSLLDEQVAGLSHEGDAGGVVAAVLEPPQPIEENGAGFSRSGVSDDSAHAQFTPGPWTLPRRRWLV